MLYIISVVRHTKVLKNILFLLSISVRIKKNFYLVFKYCLKFCMLIFKKLLYWLMFLKKFRTCFSPFCQIQVYRNQVI